MSKRKANSTVTSKTTDLRKDIGSLDDLKAYHRKIAKRANQRMLRIERASLHSGAYALAQIYLADTKNSLKKSGLRFTESANPKMDKKELITDIREIESFLNSKSSQVVTIKKAIIKRKETFKKKGIDLDELGDDFIDFLNSAMFKHMSQTMINSDRLVEGYKNSATDKEKLKKYRQLLEEYEDGKISNLRQIEKKLGSRVFKFF